jgi:hypothetical protein
MYHRGDGYYDTTVSSFCYFVHSLDVHLYNKVTVRMGINSKHVKWPTSVVAAWTLLDNFE